MKTLSNQLTILEQRLGVQFSTESAQRLGYMLGHQSLDQAIYKPLSYIGDRVIGLLHALHTPDARCRNVI